jgi:surfeit locus 1 family protein
MPIRAARSLAVIFALVAVACARLGLWQVDRLEQRRRTNAGAAASRALPVVALGPSPGPRDTALAGRRVVAMGRYDHDRTIILRGQVLRGVPGVHVVTPLRLVDTTATVLVNRGFVPAPDATTAPPIDSIRESGLVRVEGVALALTSGDGGHPITRRGQTSWGRLDLAALRESLPYPVLGIGIRRTGTPGSPPSFPRALPLPALDDGPHLSYALQWFGFAALATIFAGIVWWKRS